MYTQYMKSTTLRVSPVTKECLRVLGEKGQSFDSIIADLLLKSRRLEDKHMVLQSELIDDLQRQALLRGVYKASSSTKTPDDLDSV